MSVGGRCLVMEGPPNGVPTQRGGIHGDPVTTQHQAPVTLDNQWRAARNILTKGRGGREKQQRLMCNHPWERQSRHCKHVGDKRALRACGAPHMTAGQHVSSLTLPKLHLATFNSAATSQLPAANIRVHTNKIYFFLRLCSQFGTYDFLYSALPCICGC